MNWLGNFSMNRLSNSFCYIVWNLLLLSCISICIFAYSSQFTDSHIVPKWLYGLLSVSFCIGYFAVGVLFNRTPRLNFSLIGVGLVVVCCISAVLGILQYVGLYPPHSSYLVTGCFDNPAGFASSLCASLPFAGILISSSRQYIKVCGWIAVFLIVVAVSLSQSRAGIVSMAVAGIFYLWGKWDDRHLRLPCMHSLVIMKRHCRNIRH